jgi:NADH dehydrogenase FAD-containing subunit
MKRMNWVWKVTIVALVSGLASLAAAQDAFHVVSGVVTKIDKDAKTIGVKTEDGTEHVFKYTEKTALHGYKEAGKGVKAGALDTYFAGKEGTHVVVRYSKKGGDEVASGVEDLGKDTVKLAKGTVTKVDKAGHTVTIKTDDGAEATYSFGKDAAGDSKNGIVKGWDYTASRAKEGDKVVVHYSEDAGKKVVHFFE